MRGKLLLILVRKPERKGLRGWLRYKHEDNIKIYLSCGVAGHDLCCPRRSALNTLLTFGFHKTWGISWYLSDYVLLRTNSRVRLPLMPWTTRVAACRRVLHICWYLCNHYCFILYFWRTYYFNRNSLPEGLYIKFVVHNISTSQRGHICNRWVDIWISH